MNPAIQQKVLDQIEYWRRELINLTRRNRLLYFKPTRTSTLEITEPGAGEFMVRLSKTNGKGLPFFEPEKAQDGVEKYPEPGDLVTSAADADRLSASIRRLERRSTEEFNDKGLWILYAAVGSLEWVEGENADSVRSPLVLVPVTLRRDGPQNPVQLCRRDEDIVVNPALIAKLGHDFGLTLPPLPDAEDLDIEMYLESVRSAVADQAGWAVHPTVVLTLFGFHKQAMYQDLLANVDKIANHELVQAIAAGTASGVNREFDVIAEEDLDQRAPVGALPTILDADASQRQAIAAAAAGNTFVMDGPPGTGKSQTIANMIASLLSNGKTVLFVSEKAAALEVVQARLERAGLGPYLLALHSHKATRREVAHELGKALLTRPRAVPGMSAVESGRLESRRRSLSEYAEALNEHRQPLGYSLQTVLGMIARLQHLPQAIQGETDLELTPGTLARLRDAAAALSRAWTPAVEGVEFPWRDVRPVDLDSARRFAVTRLLESSIDDTQEIAACCGMLANLVGLEWVTDVSDARRWVALLHLASDRPDVPTDWLAAASLDPLRTRLEDRARLAGLMREIEGRATDVAGADWAKIDPSGLGALHEIRRVLRGASAEWQLSGHETASELRRLAHYLGEASATLGAIVAPSADLARTFGLSTRDMGLTRASDVASLALLAVEPDRPEPEWFDPSVLEAVKAGAGVLQTVVEDFRTRQQALGEVFTAGILDLDLEGLCVRFETVHRGLGKLRRAYWHDKRAVASCTRAGRVTKQAVGALRDALAWKQTSARLAQAERRHAVAIGEHYYQRTDSDFAALGNAVEVAARALAIAGRQLDAQLLGRQIGRTAPVSPERVALARDLRDAITALQASATEVLADRADVITTRPLPDASERCGRISTALASLADIMDAVETACGRRLDVSRVGTALELRSHAQDLADEMANAAESDARVFGPLFQGFRTDWSKLQEALGWADAVRACACAGAGLPADAASRLLEETLDPTKLKEALGRWDRNRDAVASLFETGRDAEVGSALESSFASGTHFLGQLRERIDDLPTWEAYRRALAELEEVGLAEASRFCIDHKVASHEVPGVIERAALERWADSILRSDGRLAVRRPEDRDELVREFASLDRRSISTAAARVIDACNRRVTPRMSAALNVIRREAQKQRRIMPIRRLLSDTAPAALALKPCFMMSPLAVSQFLDSEIKFDVVIFDEASQVRPADAVNCIYRGHQLIVAGDQKQLPPTEFFAKATTDEGTDDWNDEQTEDFESVLDLAKASGVVQSIPLRWHYRSRHEDLISFSNHAFYDGKLVTFPGAHATGPDVGVELFKVDGIYRRGTSSDNPIEAEKVVERVVFHAQHHPTLTLGVVAFSEAQASLIDARLQQARAEHPEVDRMFSGDRLTSLFVKNLENVQGDDRDIIIFSVGYGRDEDGKFALAFGPINKNGGWRRLNVAITRARRRVEVVSSITAEDFPAGVSNRGAKALRDYLDFAARTENKLLALRTSIDQTGGDPESPFEEEVARVIRSWGYEVVPQVGSAGYRVDIGIRHPSHSGRFILGIECDGAAYHSSKVARDRDRLRQEVLEGLGWRLYRIWGPAWYRTRALQEAKLRRAIEDAAGRVALRTVGTGTEDGDLTAA